MGELVIQAHDFDEAKKELQKFSKQTKTKLNFETVDESKGVGEFLGDLFLGRGIGLNHQVTGEELNNLTTQIQKHLKKINRTQIKLIKEFGQVYRALEALDKEYIQAILASISATDETSKGIQETQEQIKKIIENQKKTLENLKKFKQRLDGYSHLSDIDEIWNDCQGFSEEINVLSGCVAAATESSKKSIQKTDALKIALLAAEKKIEDFNKQTSGLIEKLKAVMAFTNALEKITHIKDIDEMWESLSSARNSISNISDELCLIQNALSENQANIDILIAFMEKVTTLEHLEEIDNIWNSVEEHTAHINELESKSEEFADSIKKSKEYADEKFAEAIKKTNTAVESLAKRIKYAYLIAGGSIGLAIIELILLIMREI